MVEAVAIGRPRSAGRTGDSKAFTYGPEALNPKLEALI